MQVSLQQAAMPKKVVAAVSKLQQMIAKGKVLDGASGHALAVLASLRIAAIALPLKLVTNPVTLERLKKRMPVLPELRMRSVSQLVAVALAAILVIRARPSRRVAAVAVRRPVVLQETLIGLVTTAVRPARIARRSISCSRGGRKSSFRSRRKALARRGRP